MRNIYKDFENEELEPDFHNWDNLDLFYHLIDLHQIPYEEEFNNWRDLRAQMLIMCNESYEHQKD